MEFNYIADGIDALVIDNFYTEEELNEIFKELSWVTKPSIFVDERGLSTAEMGETIIASKKGIFLDGIISYWRYSALMKYPLLKMNESSFKETLLSKNSLFKLFYGCNKRTHLLSYYENNDYYGSHIDATVCTILNWFYKEPKQFTGGEIILRSETTNKIAEIECKNNRVVLMAGNTPHEVKPIISNLNDSYSGYGRYCNAIFLNIADSKESRESLIK